MPYLRKYENPYYLICMGIVIIFTMLGINPGDSLQMLFLLLGFVFIIAGFIILGYKFNKRSKFRDKIADIQTSVRRREEIKPKIRMNREEIKPKLNRKRVEFNPKKEKALNDILNEVEALIEKKQYSEAKDKLEWIIRETKRLNLYEIQIAAHAKYNKYKEFWEMEKEIINRRYNLVRDPELDIGKNKLCTKCGQKNPIEAKFCTDCGYDLN